MPCKVEIPNKVVVVVTREPNIISLMVSSQAPSPLPFFILCFFVIVYFVCGLFVCGKNKTKAKWWRLRCHWIRHLWLSCDLSHFAPRTSKIWECPLSYFKQVYFFLSPCFPTLLCHMIQRTPNVLTFCSSSRTTLAGAMLAFMAPSYKLPTSTSWQEKE